MEKARKDCRGCFGASFGDCQRRETRIFNGMQMADQELEDTEQEEFIRRRNVDGENIVGMKLIDAVKGMPDDIEMCIGAGRAFMFCGNRNEFYKDIDHVNHHQVKIVERKMKKAYNGILKKFKELKTSKVSIESLRKKSELLEELFEEYYKCVKYLMGYGRIEERKIESANNRIHKNSIAIIVEGTENGGFWDKEEYDRWRSKL